MSRETGISDLEKTESYVNELLSQKLLKKADLRNDRTILKLTYRSSFMMQTFLPGTKSWYWKSKPFFGLFFAAFGIIDLAILNPANIAPILAIFNGISFVALGAAYFAMWWLYGIRGRKQILELENKERNSIT